MQREELLEVWNRSLETLLTAYDTPQRFDDFPTLAEVFTGHGAVADDLPILERAFAAHEIGAVPNAHAAFIRQISRTHQLGLVSNICSHPETWLSTCDSAEVF